MKPPRPADGSAAMTGVQPKPNRAPKAEAWHAAWVLRLLIDPGIAAADAGRIDWDVLVSVARGNSVLVRAAERLAARGVRLPEGVAAAVQSERERIRSTLELMRHVSRACEARGIEFLFPKAFQDYPDFGDDVDLLLLLQSPRVDRAIIAGLQASTVARDLGERISGAATYAIAGCPSPLDVQHGRLGIVGEHGAFPTALLRNSRRVVVDGTEFALPRPEDQLVLQGLQRISGRLRIALCDVIFTASTIRGGALDWDYIIGTARQHGAFPGLCCYLSYVEQIYRDALWQPLFSEAQRRALVLRGWGRVEFRLGAYRFPVVRVNTRLYAQQLRSRIRTGDWGGVGRLCLIPIVAAARLVRRLTRRARLARTPGDGPARTERLAGRAVNA